ncbi:hypothetical protein FAF38_12355 [Staphylococcus aureus]|nr:hypothetical protein HMPREF0782_1513 [Staphylococcus aureus subsp. aureus ATCC 51811]EFK81001.1 hypothetical protein HMPREF0773_12663 [Staphylococcus aureus subsp. aureus TCH70]OVZ42168.1 hypothetical protein CDC55_06155 [Staphylococcus aureus]OVZ47781.1 hypothetical protein CDC56_03175 [Staphylococcus aureus]OVZ51544.1 hypothetical protein CDC57_09150 [Staphylococcus aureus]
MFRLIGSGTEIIFNKIYFVLPQLAHYCKLTESQLLCWGPTRIEKSLLQAYFLSVNYCQYNIVVPRTLNL